nr:MAG TPA: hypothetical protein [Bacteriophage sp.]
MCTHILRKLKVSLNRLKWRLTIYYQPFLKIC